MPASDSPVGREKNPVRQIWRDVDRRLIAANAYWDFYLTIHLNYPQDAVDEFLEERMREHGGREHGG